MTKETKAVATTETKAVAAPKQTIRSLIEGDEFKKQVALALPKHLTPDRFIRVAINAMMRTPTLAQCDHASFFNCLLNLSALGLEPDGRRAHLIPYWNSKRNCHEAQLIVDYKGLVELAMRSGKVSLIHADVVCENDLFEYDLGEIKAHKINFREPRGEMYAAYCVIRMKDGTVKAEVMSKNEIEAIRKRSRAGNAGPWITDFNEMAKKGLALDTPIPTPDGWTTMEGIKVGDMVFDSTGKPTRVIAVSEIKNLPCYRVTMTNGDYVVCDNEHRWVATIGKGGSHERKSHGWPVHNIKRLYEAKGQKELVSIPVASPIQPETRASMPIDPWCLGYWIGNGRKNDGNITAHGSDVVHVENSYVAAGYEIGAVRKDPRANATSIGVKGFKQDLRNAGVLGNKQIPPCYLRADYLVRLELLRGLMDSDGCIERERGKAIFSSTSLAIAEQVYELIHSLGETALFSAHNQNGYGKTVLCYRIEWQSSVCPVSSPRKASKWRPRKLALYRAIKSIVPVESVPTRCIAVDSPTKTYLCGKTFIVTHNTVFRRASKWIELSPELRDAFEKDDDKIPEFGAPVAPVKIKPVKLDLPAVEAPPPPVAEEVIDAKDADPDLSAVPPVEDPEEREKLIDEIRAECVGLPTRLSRECRGLRINPNELETAPMDALRILLVRVKKEGDRT